MGPLPGVQPLRACSRPVRLDCASPQKEPRGERRWSASPRTTTGIPPQKNAPRDLAAEMPACKQGFPIRQEPATPKPPQRDYPALHRLPRGKVRRGAPPCVTSTVTGPSRQCPRNRHIHGLSWALHRPRLSSAPRPAAALGVPGAHGITLRPTRATPGVVPDCAATQSSGGRDWSGRCVRHRSVTHL